MEGYGFTKRDWLLFKSRIGGWQEAYMDKLNHEYMEILSSDENPSDKFWALEKRIRTDKRSIGVCIDMRRSMFYLNLFALLDNGIISINDLDDFSDEVKGRLSRFYLQENIIKPE